jgi:hypothetical protein
LNENASNAWIDYFARSGFVDHYHKSMDKMEILQRNVYRQLNLELIKKPKE